MKKRLFLIDAHAYLHRAFHALPPLTTRQGKPVGALLGFAKMLRKLIREERPQAVAVCFDTPEPTFRHEMSEAYKATRQETDPALISQLDEARAMTEALGLPSAALPGFEADDVMATLADKAVRGGFEAVLVTGDKDALQLVGGGIRVYNAAKDVWMDPPAVREKFGVPPEAMLDYLSIVGDSSDNVAGIKGIGPAGAKGLLSRFGTLKDAIAAAKAGDGSIKPGVRRKLIEGEKSAEAAAALIRLRRDAPLKVTLEDCKAASPDPEKARPVLERLEFFSLLRDILPGYAGGPGAAAAGANGAPAPAAASPDLKEASPEEVAKEARRAKALSVVALLDPDESLLASARVHLAVGLPDGRTAFWTGEPQAAEKKWLKTALAGKTPKLGYDLKQTRRALALCGLPFGGEAFDAMLAAYCLDASTRAVTGKDLPKLLRERAALALGRERLEEEMEAAGVEELYADIELPVSEVLRLMEDEGVALDAPYLRKLGREFEAEIAQLKEGIDALAGAPLNPNSPKQLAELLYDKLGLPVAHKTAKGGRSTDEAALRTLAQKHPIPAKVLEYRELTKLKSNYIDGMLERMDPGTGRVHTTFDQTGTATGRLSSQDPNLQNIPIRSAQGKRIRRAFTARKGCVLVSADYSQIDLRVLAHVSKDPVLRGSFAKDEDIHRRTASEVFHVDPEDVDKEMRRRAKAVNFGIVYGQTAFGLGNELGIPHGEAAALIKKYFARYAGVERWIKENIAAAKREGLVRTWSGRLRRIPELSASSAAVRQFGERAATNTPIQGGSADVIKAAMLEVARGLSRRRSKARMILQIHDELLFDVPKAEAEAFAGWVRGVMEKTELEVPFKVDVKTGANWQDMEPTP